MYVGELSDSSISFHECLKKCFASTLKSWYQFISFTENFLGFDTIGQNVEVLKEVFSHIIETVEGEFMSDLMSKSFVDVNINSDFKKRKNPQKKGKNKLKLY